MIPKNLYRQFLIMNKQELFEAVTSFNELNEVSQHLMALYLDMEGWELLDMRVGKVIAKFPYKHLRDLREFMDILRHTFINVGCACSGVKNSLSRLTTDYKRLCKWYSENEIERIYPNITEALWNQQRKRNCYR